MGWVHTSELAPPPSSSAHVDSITRVTKHTTCTIARLALADGVAAMLRVESVLTSEAARSSEPWLDENELTKQLATAVAAMMRIGHAFRLEPIELVPESTCGRCERSTIDYRHVAGVVTCSLCLEDFEARFRRVVRDLTQLSAEHGDAEALGDRLLSELAGSP